MNQAVSDLELSEDEMTAMGQAALRVVVEHIARLPRSPASNIEDAARIVGDLREPPPESGTDFDALLRFVMEKVVPVSLNAAHPGYLAYIPGGGLFPSAVADLVASATNRYVGVWYAAPAAARLETNVLEWFAEWMGYPSSARGILTSGGSLANFSAIVAARKHLLGDDLSKGTLYASDQTHHAVMKSAMLAGIPEKNIRLLETDESYRAVPERFDQAIREDRRNGLRPFLVVGNAGTTNTGAVDPLGDLAEVSRRHALWYHIDGAYGGFFNLCEEGRRRLAGIELSDSVVLDPHKGLFVPYGCGSLVVREGDLLRQAHMLSADYLQDQFTPEGEVNFSEYSPELSRSFRGLRVWLPLKLYGVDAFRRNLEEKLDLTRWLYERFVEEPGFECLAPPDLTVIAFRYWPKHGDADAFNQHLLKAINARKRFYLSSTRLRGRFAIRVCILSFRTHRETVEEAFEIIRSVARELDESSDAG